MKVHSYAKNMNLNRKCWKKGHVVETQNFDLLEHKMVIFYFLPQMF